MKNLSGKRFGRLFVTDNFERRKTKSGSRIYWECQCDCGNKVYVSGSSLRIGKTKSCGCYQREWAKQKHTKDGLSGTRLYKIWVGMNQRCFNPNNSAWNHYGGRGISVCDEWAKTYDGFIAFYEWSIKNGYSDLLTIERIDVHKDYSPNNCKWETWKKQKLNTTNTVRINYLGKQVPLITVCRELGINYSTAITRMKNGCSTEDILSTKKLRRGTHRKVGINEKSDLLLR